MTGRAAGFCAGYDEPGYASPMGGRGMGRGRRRGWGFGFGRGFGARFLGRGAVPQEPATGEQTPQLRQQIEALAEQMAQIQQRLDAMADERE